MEIVSAIFAVALVLFAVHTYFTEKSVVSDAKEGKAVVCNGAVLKKPEVVELGGELYIRKGKLMFHVDSCQRLPQDKGEG